jgi:uncharacterized Zn finger protein
VTRENVDVKGRRLLTEGRLDIHKIEQGDRGLVWATCRGDSGASYTLGFDPRNLQWRCTCEARRRCSHLVALQLVVTRSTRGGT